MVAANIFNAADDNSNIKKLYGVVTTGTAWKFLKMVGLDVVIDLDEYAIDNPDKIIGIFIGVEDRLGAWVRGQATLGLTIGIMTAIGLSLLGLPYVLPLSIFAGLLEAVPNIGPIVSAIPAILIALTISPLMGLVTALLYFIIQQAENHLIVPFVMRKVVGLPPLVTMIALLIGGKLAGIPGALLGVPIVVTMQTIISEYYKLKTATKE